MEKLSTTSTRTETIDDTKITPLEQQQQQQQQDTAYTHSQLGHNNIFQLDQLGLPSTSGRSMEQQLQDCDVIQCDDNDVDRLMSDDKMTSQQQQQQQLGRHGNIRGWKLSQLVPSTLRRYHVFNKTSVTSLRHSRHSTTRHNDSHRRRHLQVPHQQEQQQQQQQRGEGRQGELLGQQEIRDRHSSRRSMSRTTSIDSKHSTFQNNKQQSTPTNSLRKLSAAQIVANTLSDRADRQLQVFSRKKSDMFVILDREDSLYIAGETIKGRVHIVLTQDVKVKDLVVRFYGFGRVSWDEQRAYIKGSAPSVLFKNSEVYLDYSTSLLKKDLSAILSTQCSALTVSDVGSEEGIVLPAGNHCFPFEYILPRTLPSTYEGRWGQVKYVVKAVLQRPWKFDIDREADLSIKAFIDLNDEPELARPIGGLSEYAAGVMCIRSGPITVELRVGRRGYVPGETIQLSADVENNSRYKLYHCRMALMQHVTFRAGRKLRKTSVSVASVEKDDILPMSTIQWNNDSLVVPALPPTTNKGHRNIEIRYTISLFVKYSSWTDAFCLPVAVSVGTVALRRQTINTYLAMLGYGQTPRASPATTRRASHTDTTPTTAAGRCAARPSVSSAIGKTCEQHGRQPTNGSSSTGNTYGSTSNTAATSRDSPRNKSTPLSLEQPSPLNSGSPGSPVSPLADSVAARRSQLGQFKAKNRSQDSGDSTVLELEKQQQ